MRDSARNHDLPRYRPMTRPILFILATAFAMPASAQSLPRTTQTALIIQIRADQPRNCRITPGQGAALDPLSRGWQRISLPSVACNYAGRPAVRFWSQNSGALVPEGALALNLPAGLAYELRVGGIVVGRPGSSGNPLVSTLPPADPKQPRNTEVAIRFTGPTPPPGTFADTIYMEVTP